MARKAYDLHCDTLMKLAKKLAVHMTEVLNCDGFNLLQNNHEVAGQTVFHFHIHLIPRYQEDKQHLVMKPCGMTAEELDAVRDQIVG